MEARQISRTLHSRLDDIKRVNKKCRYGTGGQARDCLDEGGRDALMVLCHRGGLSKLSHMAALRVLRSFHLFLLDKVRGLQSLDRINLLS